MGRGPEGARALARLSTVATRRSSTRRAPAAPGPVDRQPLGQVVAQRVLGPIREEKLETGAKLPSEHELMGQLSVGVDLRGTWLCCRAAIRCFLRAGRAGAIVCTSSPAAEVGLPGGTAAYSAAKGGVSALVRSLAVEYAGRGIRVNAIAPGPTETELMWANVDGVQVRSMRRQVADEVPVGRLADPREPALAALWLLSDEASYVTGAQLAVDGGVLARASVSV
jgi:NAD(P)-dependent dehydrogenase (short-subunit alcohol dehydrogenase family)